MFALDRTPRRLVLTAGLLATLLGLTAGCYERVVSSKTYPGWNPSGLEQPATAPDYSGVEMVHKKKKGFNPIGDFIVEPIGGAFNAIGNAFAGDDDSSKSGHNDGRDGSRAGDKTTSQGGANSGVSNSGDGGNTGGVFGGTSEK